MPADIPSPRALPRTSGLPVVAILIIAVIALGWGVAMFFLGRSSVTQLPDNTAASVTAALAAIQRVDHAVSSDDFASARAQLANLIATGDRLLVAMAAERNAHMDQIEAERAADTAAKIAAAQPDAIAARVAVQLWTIPEAVINELVPPSPPTSPMSDKTPEGQEATEQNPTPVVESEVKPLPPINIAGRSVTPLAQVQFPRDDQRQYALTPHHGLVRSDDGGQTWRIGHGALRDVQGDALWFTTGERPLLIIRGPLWLLFADSDPAFFNAGP